jgi:hypothetical protein
VVIYSDLTNSVVSGYESVALRAGVASKNPHKFQWFANERPLKGTTGNTLGVSAALKILGLTFSLLATALQHSQALSHR